MFDYNDGRTNQQRHNYLEGRLKKANADKVFCEDGRSIDVFCGNYEYNLGGGWKCEVFYDCYEFDYIDSIITPEGFQIDLFDHDDVRDYLIPNSLGYSTLADYYPNNFKDV